MSMTHKKHNQANTHLLHYVVIYAWLVMMAAVLEEDDSDHRRLRGSTNIRRERIPVSTNAMNETMAAEVAT